MSSVVGGIAIEVIRGQEKKKGGRKESKKDGLVKVSLWRHMSSLKKSKEEKSGVESEELSCLVLSSLERIKMVPPGFDPGTLTTSR